MKKQLFAYAMGVLSLGLLASCTNNLDETSLDPSKNGKISMKLAGAPKVNAWSGSEVLAGEAAGTRANENLVSKYLTDEVEVNLALLDVHALESGAQKYDVADLVSKLSIHIRSGKDVKVVLPVGKEYYCDQDDMYIFNRHGGELFANGGNLAENTSSVKIKFGKSGSVLPPTGGETPDPEDPKCEGDGDCCGGNNEGECQEPNDNCGQGGCCCDSTPEHGTCDNCEEAHEDRVNNNITCTCQNFVDGVEDDPENYDKWCHCNKRINTSGLENPEGPSMYAARANEEGEEGEGDVEVEYEITVNIQFNDADITIWTEGVTEEAINWLKANYGDGLNIEVFNYYNRANQYKGDEFEEWTLTGIKNALDQSTVEFTEEEGSVSSPDYYINAFTGDETILRVGEELETVYRDCYVTPINWNTYFNAPYFDYHFNGFDKNLIYVSKSVEGGKVGTVDPATDATFRLPAAIEE